MLHSSTGQKKYHSWFEDVITPISLKGGSLLPDDPSVPVVQTQPQEGNQPSCTDGPSPSMRERELPPHHDDQVRWFLVRSTVVLMVMTLLTYIVTRDIAVLGTTTVIGIAVIAVFRYYFTRSKGGEVVRKDGIVCSNLCTSTLTFSFFTNASADVVAKVLSPQNGNLI